MLINLDEPLLIEVSGTDAGKILHNLTTNQMQNLAEGAAIESFVTDLRGWVVAHGIVFRLNADRWWIIGQHPDSSRVASHIDRYIIREDARVVNLSGRCTLGLYLSTNSRQDERQDQSSNTLVQHVAFASFDPSAELVVSIHEHPPNSQAAAADVASWDRERILRFWPKMGTDIWEKCIPQEIDRTSHAISFTKGCYLGQETIARLDALGQIQKKLCLLKIDSTDIRGTPIILAGEKEVGSVTSTMVFDGATWALAVIRRSHFSVGTHLTCDGHRAVVVSPKELI